jgi:hypothetical protein
MSIVDESCLLRLYVFSFSCLLLLVFSAFDINASSIFLRFRMKLALDAKMWVEKKGIKERNK